MEPNCRLWYLGCVGTFRWDTGTEMWTVDDSRWGKVGRVRREAEKLWYIETTSKLSKVKISQNLWICCDCALLYRSLCVLKIFKGDLLLVQAESEYFAKAWRGSPVHRFLLIQTWFREEWLSDSEVVSVSPLKLQPLLPQVGVGPVMPTIWHDPWLPKAHDLGRQVAVLRGTAYATPGERAIIALRGKP